jgi:hypothetical protein
MAIPCLIVVMLGPIVPVEDLDTFSTLLLVGLALGIGWFLWRRT